MITRFLLMEQSKRVNDAAFSHNAFRCNFALEPAIKGKLWIAERMYCLFETTLFPGTVAVVVASLISLHMTSQTRANGIKGFDPRTRPHTILPQRLDHADIQNHSLSIGNNSLHAPLDASIRTFYILSIVYARGWLFRSTCLTMNCSKNYERVIYVSNHTIHQITAIPFNPFYK